MFCAHCIRDLSADVERVGRVMAALDCPPGPAKIFVALWNAENRVISHSVLAEHIERDRENDAGSVRKAVQYLRQKMPDDWGVVVKNIYGVGFMMIRPKGADFDKLVDDAIQARVVR